MHRGIGAGREGPAVADHVTGKPVRGSRRLGGLRAGEPCREIPGIEAVSGRHRIDRNHDFRNRHELLRTGNRDQILQHVGTILQMQAEIVKLQGGLSGPLVTPQNAFDALEVLTENAGFKQSFFTDPSNQQNQPGGPPQPPPDPKMMQAQHQMQLDQQKAQIDAQVQQTRLQADLQIQQAKLQAEQQAARERAQFEMELEKVRAQHAMQLELQREQAKADLARYEIDARAKAGAYTPGPAAA